MPFGATPADQGAAVSPDEDVLVINFIVDPLVWTVTRGVGENSHIVTLKITGGPAEENIPWNSANEVNSTDLELPDWTFLQSDYEAFVGNDGL